MEVKQFQPISIKHNVSLNVIDERTGQLVQHHEGHNAATNSMMIGIAKYLTGDGVFNQGKDMLANYIPQYISLGTLGLHSQDQDAEGLPTGISVEGQSDEEAFSNYMAQSPGYGADGYNMNLNNSRSVFGLGLPFTNYDITHYYQYGDYCMYKGTLYCCIATDGTYGSWNASCWTPAAGEDPNAPHFGELITPSFPRVRISYREVVPEAYSELPCTIDVIYSAMISTGAMRQFRYANNDYIFITEAGLWSRADWEDNGANGLIAGYRIAPPNKMNWCMAPDQVTDDVLAWFRANDPDTPQDTTAAKIYIAACNRDLLKQNILRVGPNQVVQVVWKVQLGSIEQFGGLSAFYQQFYTLYWEDGSTL